MHPKSVEKLKRKLKIIIDRSNAMSMAQRMLKSKQAITGWGNYFRIADMRTLVKSLEIRMCLWKQWKRIRTKHDNIVRLGIGKPKAWEYANTRKDYRRISNSPVLARSVTTEHLKGLRFQSIAERYSFGALNFIESLYAERYVWWRDACNQEKEKKIKSLTKLKNYYIL